MWHQARLPPGILALALVALVFAASGCATAGADYTDPAALATLIEKKAEPYILVDVRTAEEYATGYIPTAVNIPVDAIGSKPPTEDKAALIIVYCRSGARSARAKKTLEDLGYTRVQNFGAVSNWAGELARP